MAELEGFSPTVLRRLLHAKVLASERVRGALARTLGLGETEAGALAHLAQEGQLTPGELAQRLGLTSGGMAAVTHRLERAGHLVRRPHPRDRRSVMLAPAAAIVAAAEELYAPLTRELDAVAERLPERDRAVIGTYLGEIVAVTLRHSERLAANLQDDPDDVIAAPAPGLWA